MIKISCLFYVDVEVTLRSSAFLSYDGISFGDGKCGELVDKESGKVNLIVEIAFIYFMEEKGVEGCFSCLLNLFKLVHSIH